MGKGLSYSRNWGIGINYCWNYGPLKLPLYFIEYRLDQLNIKHKKTAASSTIQYFEGRSQKKCLLRVWSSLVYPPQNGSPVNFFSKLNRKHLLMASIFKLHQYQTFRLMKMHNMCKIWFVNNILSLLKWNKKYFSDLSRAFNYQKLSQIWDCAINCIGY